MSGSLRLIALSAVIAALPAAVSGQSAVPAAETLRSMSANNGMYSNRIADFTPPAPYSEVCFVDGAVQTDIHAVSEPPTGGNCEPGDVGWMMERDERSSVLWETARAECLMAGMRLPEPFEWKFSCKNEALFGLNDMTGSLEWASNFVTHQSEVTSGTNGIGAATLGGELCADGSWSWIATGSGVETTVPYRCVR